MDAAKQKKPLSDLDPIDRASEVVFGTLMAMSFSGTLSVATAGEQDVHTMMLAALGCNLAWGLTDGVMFLVAAITEDRRKAGLLVRLHNARDNAEANRLIADELPPRLQTHANPAVYEAIRESLMNAPEQIKVLNFRRIRDAVQVFLLVVLSTFPIVLPFMFVEETMLALRLSNLMGLLTLFVSGYFLGRFADGRPLRFAFGMSLIGAVMIAVIIALGG
ncbi:MAG: VIT1/CCC1 transporter family protein [Arenimonas sp.]|nr:VIT1/CCC1 transporter family protein [Arenimonas sp.]MBP7917405.1 VIT1/CCC1 transporter family protein [Arenimonas sp.]